MSAKKIQVSPRQLIGVARRRLDSEQSFGGRVLSWVVNFCHNFLAQDVENTLKNYFCVIMTGSLLSAVVDMPRDFYIVGKRNVLNMYFVKWSWAWTLLLLGGFLASTVFVYAVRSFKIVIRTFLRLAIATSIWWICIRLFDMVEHHFSACSISSYKTVTECSTSSGKWHSFEFSGHVFILTYIALITAEEMSIFERWYLLGHILRKDNFVKDSYVDAASTLAELSEDDQEIVLHRYNSWSWLVELFYVFNIIACSLWFFMVVITSLYYHSFEQKAAAFVAAFLCWYATYRLWYTRQYPGSPGFGRIHL